MTTHKSKVPVNLFFPHHTGSHGELGKISTIGVILFFIIAMFSCGGTDGETGQDTSQAEYANQAERLGYPSDKRVVILHADDIGMFEESNTAVIPYLTNQQIQSASVMMPCEYADEFMQWFKANPDYDIGLHLTLTSEFKNWRWSTVAAKESVPGLLDENGFMWPTSEEVVLNADPEEVEAEVRAQIEKALSLQVRPTHLDTHMATLYASTAFLERYLDIAEEYQIPALVFDLSKDAIIQKFQEIGISVTDELVAMCDRYSLPKLDGFCNIPNVDSYEDLRATFFELVASLEPGITQIYFHPSVESENLMTITDSWQKRVWEARLFADPEVIAFLEDEEIIFTSWKELMERLFSY